MAEIQPKPNTKEGQNNYISEEIIGGNEPCQRNVPQKKRIQLDLRNLKMRIDVPLYGQHDPDDPVYDGGNIRVWLSTNPCSEEREGLFLLPDKDCIDVLEHFPKIRSTYLEAPALAERILLLNTCYPHDDSDKDNTQVLECLEKLSEKGYVSATIALANAHMYRSNEIREGKGSVYLTEDEKSEIQQEKNSSAATKEETPKEDYQIIANYHETEAKKYGKKCDASLSLNEKTEKEFFNSLKESVLNCEAKKTGEDLLKLYLLDNYIPTNKFQPSKGSKRIGCATFFITTALFTLITQSIVNGMTSGDHPYLCLACGLLVGAAFGVTSANYAKRQKHNDASYLVKRLMANRRDFVNS